MKRNILATLLFLLGLGAAMTQELNAKVTIEHRQVQGTNKQIFETLEKSLNEFLNGRQWTEGSYKKDEKIDCSFLLNITSLTPDNQMTGNLTVQARRPVFNSNYNTTLINTRDNNVSFKYVEFDVLEFNENIFRDNLTSLFAFYAYIIIGSDNDTFSKEGGSDAFATAEKIARNAQTQDAKGWKQDAMDRNRWMMIEQILHPNFDAYRTMLYNYHRKGLDIMANAPALGRKQIAEALISLEKVHGNVPTSMLLQTFFDAKNEEIINIFKPAQFDEKQKIGDLLKKIDPSRIRNYEAMLRG